MKKKFKLYILLLLLISSTLTGCEKKEELVTESAYMLGTHIEISIWTDNVVNGKASIQKSFKRIEEIEKRMSVNIKESDISLLNKSAGKNSVKVNPDTAHVLNKAIKYARISEGAFDPTIGRLVKLWGIGTEKQKIPDNIEIQNALKYVDYEMLKPTAENEFMLDMKGMQIDLGGIAKGYAGDEVYNILKSSGIKRAIINLGGNVLTLGKKADGSEWKVGIQNPLKPTGTHMGIVQVSDKSVVTSGNYERYFISDERKYHHILDTKTGYPVDNGIISTTIIAKSSIDADALSTAVFVKGINDGLKLIESLDNVECIIITDDYKIYLSSGMEGKLTIVDNQFKLAD